MFRENRSHEQPKLLSTISALPDKYRKRLEESWAGVFYREVFCRIDESIFAVLYASEPSRPNTAVNILVALEILKAGFGWSDEEMYDAFLYDVQVRFAVGNDDLTEGHCELRTVYNFRQRLAKYEKEHGINLMQECFRTITDGQRLEYRVRSRMLRMDSTQIASNIVDASRLQLLVEGVQRLWRLLTEEEQGRWSDLCAAYVGHEAEHYVYGIKGRAETDAAIQRVGQVLAGLLHAMRADYAQEAVYQTVERLFGDNFHLEAQGVKAKANDEISAGALQSLDDLEATYRRKGSQSYKGYVANVTETCDPENDVQLIVDVQLASNNVDDASLLVDALPRLKEQTEVEQLYTDGGFGSPQADQACHDHQVIQIQSGIRGKAPDSSKLSLSSFDFELDEAGKPTQITCPHGQQVAVESGRSTGFVARFDPAICAQCPAFLLKRCRAQPQKRDPRFALNFTQNQVFWAQRRRRFVASSILSHNPRAAVESTIRSLKHPFGNGKLPVRGRFRMTCMVIGSALMCNLRRIQRHLAPTHPNDPSEPATLALPWSTSLFGSVDRPVMALFRLIFARFQHLDAWTLDLRHHIHSGWKTVQFNQRPRCRSRNVCFSC